MRLELGQLRVQWRLLTVLLCIALISNMAGPVLLIWHSPRSLVAAAVSLTRHPDLVACAFVAGCALVVPQLIACWVGVPSSLERLAVRLACTGLALAAVTWLLVAYVARNIDGGVLPLLLLRNGAINLLFAAALAMSLNNRQIRDQVASEGPGL